MKKRPTAKDWLPLARTEGGARHGFRHGQVGPRGFWQNNTSLGIPKWEVQNRPISMVLLKVLAGSSLNQQHTSQSRP
jgi:hypothetical protein